MSTAKQSFEDELEHATLDAGKDSASRITRINTIRDKSREEQFLLDRNAMMQMMAPGS